MIVQNAGAEASIVVGKVKESKDKNFGYNAQTDAFEDLVAAGVIDPTKVARTALQNAASIAGLMLTTRAGVAWAGCTNRRPAAAARPGRTTPRGNPGAFCLGFPADGPGPRPRVTRSPSASSPERATLSRDLADFLIELSIALHKHAMYPEGHPWLAPAAAALARRAALLLEDRPSLALGVARHQLVIEGVATDPKHPVLAELAGQLHRHHLGAVTFRRGVDVAEVADALRTLALDAERSGQPLGLGPSERLRAWPHLQLHPLTFDRLELVAPAEAGTERGARAAQLWVGLARAAVATRPGDDQPAPTEPIAIARAIDEHTHTDAAAYDQVIVGYLLQIAEELKTAGSDEAVALRRRTSRLIRALHPDTLARLVAMGGDFAQRRQFVYDATDALAVDAVLEIVKAAAETSPDDFPRAGAAPLQARRARDPRRVGPGRGLTATVPPRPPAPPPSSLSRGGAAILRRTLATDPRDAAPPCAFPRHARPRACASGPDHAPCGRRARSPGPAAPPRG